MISVGILGDNKYRYQILKEKNNKKVNDISWKSNVLFNECIDVLHCCDIISLSESEKLFNNMKKNFPMTAYGSINWNYVKESVPINDISDLYRKCDISDTYYILWDQKCLPCVSCQLSIILENLDDVLAVSFDTWLLSKNTLEVVEFYHEGRIIYGRMID